MSDAIHVKKLNEVHLLVSSLDLGIQQELRDHFTYQVPGYQHMPKYRMGVWDGTIRLYDVRKKTLYVGLLEKLKEFAEQRGYEVSLDLEESSQTDPNKLVDYLKRFKSKNGFVPRDYQITAVVKAIQKHRLTLLSPTASGKSLMIYLLHQILNRRTLLIVPTIGLVNQMAADFTAYGYEEPIHKITSGVDKKTDHRLTISTWQSIYKMPQSYFDQFEVVIGDEVHGFKATSLTAIMEKLVSCKYRFGFTGTLDEVQVNKLVIEGLFGPVFKVTTTKDLIENNTLSKFDVMALQLDYPEEDRKLIREATYADEVDFLVRHSKRNEIIRKLATTVKGNTLVLFQFVEKHGKVLYDLIKNSTDRPVYYVSGEVDGEDREIIRNVVETQSDAIIVASMGVFSTGINIVSLKNIVFASPSKSRIKVLQSIGRVLRKSDSKSEAVLFDIFDDLRWKKKKPNYAFTHFLERQKIYVKESFPYKIRKVKI